MRDTELEACRRQLEAGPRELAAWQALARWARRADRVPDFVEAGDLRVLRALLRRNLEDTSLRALALLLVGLEAAPLPGDRVPEFWRGRRQPGRSDGVWFDPHEGMPLYGVHRLTGAEMFWVPRIRAPLGVSRYRYGVAPAAGRRALAGGGYLGRFPVTQAQWGLYLADQGAGATKSSGGDAARPQVGLDQAEARRFAAWAGGALPTGVTWELAGRGEKDEEYPWGNQELNPKDCPKRWWAALLGTPAPEDIERWPPEPPPPPVGTHPKTRSVFGVEELCGHTPDWVAEPGARRGGVTLRARHHQRWRRVDLPWEGGQVELRPAPLYWEHREHGEEYPAGTGVRLWIPVDGA